jgi:hypothetical protein
MKIIYVMFLASFLLASCGNNNNEDIVSAPNKDGSVETVVSVKHEKNFDILTTTHKIWVKNKLDTTLIKLDTLKSLGTTIVEGEDQNGKAQNATVQKDYEFYITVK